MPALRKALGCEEHRDSGDHRTGGNTDISLIMCCKQVSGVCWFVGWFGVICFNLLLEISDLGYPRRTRIHIFIMIFASVLQIFYLTNTKYRMSTSV